jgi:transcriptional regulator with XRE-family HTH domain
MKSGALLQEARLRAGLTQQQLAERTGRDRAVIARWEQEVVAPSLEP